jgi:hypothetical protein
MGNLTYTVCLHYLCLVCNKDENTNEKNVNLLLISDIFVYPLLYHWAIANCATSLLYISTASIALLYVQLLFRRIKLK